jgi:hypothetical membrane protein
MKTKNLVYLGLIIPLVFWGTLVFCGLMTENYNPFSNMVSELGAIGAKTRYIFTVGLVVCAVLSILFCIGLCKIARERRLTLLPLILILTFSFSVFGAAVFPLPLKLHGILGSPVMLLPLSPLLALLFWKEDKFPKIATSIILIIMLAGLLTLLPNVLENYFGLKQRFFHVGWSLWFGYLSLKFLGLQKRFIESEKPRANELAATFGLR